MLKKVVEGCRRLKKLKKLKMLKKLSSGRS